jgi:plastocyanin
MSHDEHGHAKEPIIMTSGRRMGKGLAIVVVTLAIGAAILIPFFDTMYSNPPPVTQIRQPTPPTGGGQTPPPAEAGTTTIAILQGAATQGAPDYDPDAAEVPLGNKIVWNNQDTVPHTATSGKGPDDPESAALFDTGIVNGGESSDPVELTDVSEGDKIDYHCTVHPYMTGALTITAAAEGGGAAPGGNATTTGGGGGGAAAGGGPTLHILEGASVQGSPDYDPDPLTLTKGDAVNVVNQDTVPHTVTSGTGPTDPESASAFDSGIMDPGATFSLKTSNIDAGQYDFYCMVHPYMTGKLQVK